MTPLEHRIAALDQFVSDVADDQRQRWAELALSQGHIGPLVDDLTSAVRLEAGSAVVAISSEMTTTLETLTAEMRATMDQVGDDLLQLRDQLNLLEANSDTRVAIELERLRGEVNALKRRLPLRGREGMVLDDDQLDAIAAAVVTALGGQVAPPARPATRRRSAPADSDEGLDVPAAPPRHATGARPATSSSAAAKRQRPLRPEIDAKTSSPSGAASTFPCCSPRTGGACSPCRSRPGVGMVVAGPRAVIPLDGLVVSRSLRRSCRRYEIRVDTAFAEVVAGCADPARPQRLDHRRDRGRLLPLHEHGLGPQRGGVERGRRLAGGLYGVAIGGLFAGESMFHRRIDASKVALVALVDRLRAGGGTLARRAVAHPPSGRAGSGDRPRRRVRRPGR